MMPLDSLVSGKFTFCPRMTRNHSCYQNPRFLAVRTNNYTAKFVCLVFLKKNCSEFIEWARARIPLRIAKEKRGVVLLGLVSLCAFSRERDFIIRHLERKLDTRRGRRLVWCRVVFVHANMGTYTLPEGFTEFDMFAFGSALLVGGEFEWKKLSSKMTIQCESSNRVLFCLISMACKRLKVWKSNSATVGEK